MSTIEKYEADWAKAGKMLSLEKLAELNFSRDLQLAFTLVLSILYMVTGVCQFLLGMFFTGAFSAYRHWQISKSKDAHVNLLRQELVSALHTEESLKAQLHEARVEEAFLRPQTDHGKAETYFSGDPPSPR
jgi:hypothetical protein